MVSRIEYIAILELGVDLIGLMLGVHVDIIKYMSAAWVL